MLSISNAVGLDELEVDEDPERELIPRAAGLAGTGLREDSRWCAYAC